MPAAPAMAGSGFMSNLNPLSLMTGEALQHQQYLELVSSTYLQLRWMV
jgi:hypothetical protein